MRNILLKRLFKREAEAPRAASTNARKLETSGGGRIVRQTCGWTVVEHSNFNPYDTGVYKARQFNI